MAILTVDRLVRITGESVEHHFYRGGEIIIPNQYQALPTKGKISDWDEIPEGIYRISNLEFVNDVTQWVIFDDANGMSYIRDSKMCLVWSIPEKLRNPFGQWGKYSPFRVVADGVEQTLTAWSTVEQYLSNNQISEASIYDGYGACKEWSRS